jgi:hypothetical protein
MLWKLCVCVWKYFEKGPLQCQIAEALSLHRVAHGAVCAHGLVKRCQQWDGLDGLAIYTHVADVCGETGSSSQHHSAPHTDTAVADQLGRAGWSGFGIEEWCQG